jgi:hypothetical protein
MLATTMGWIDSTIANVALFHIRGSHSAGVDEAACVLTSYIVANAIIIPLNLQLLVFCRVLQGLGGAMMPMGVTAALMVTAFVHDPVTAAVTSRPLTGADCGCGWSGLPVCSAFLRRGMSA